MNNDPRIVYGAICTWWESIDKVAIDRNLPVCPHCKRPLFEIENMERWNADIKAYEHDGHPGYSKFMKWLRGKCYNNFTLAMQAYTDETGEKVP